MLPVATSQRNKTHHQEPRSLAGPPIWDHGRCQKENATETSHKSSQLLAPSSQSNGLRKRHRVPLPAPSQQAHDDWEVWMFSHFGGKQDTWETAPLCIDAEDDGHLFVTNLGPMANVGSSSVVVGLSNVIKVITVGQERFETEDVTGPCSGVPAVGSRRRKGPSSVRTKPPVAFRKCC